MTFKKILWRISQSLAMKFKKQSFEGFVRVWLHTKTVDWSFEGITQSNSSIFWRSQNMSQRNTCKCQYIFPVTVEKSVCSQFQSCWCDLSLLRLKPFFRRWGGSGFKQLCHETETVAQSFERLRRLILWRIDTLKDSNSFQWSFKLKQ